MTHKLLVLDPTGHSEYPWDDEGGGLAVAEQAFETEIKKGSAAFATSPATPGVSRRVTSLREVADAEEVIVVPQFVGG